MHERIKQIRKEKGLTQAAFGKLLGIAAPSVSKLESGENHPSEQTIRAICSGFNINRCWLETGTGEMEESADSLAIHDLEIVMAGSFERIQIDAVRSLLELSAQDLKLVFSVIKRLRSEKDS